jgi:hypothetical protein
MFPQDPMGCTVRYHLHRAAVGLLDVLIAQFLGVVIIKPLV